MNSADRQAVLHCLKAMIDEALCEECPLYGTTGTDHCEEDCVRLAINALEQEPKTKTGHWILADEQNKEDVENDNYRFICSECQCSDIHAKGTKVPYCWKCGAKMIEPQKSEVEE